MHSHLPCYTFCSNNTSASKACRTCIWWCVARPVAASPACWYPFTRRVSASDRRRKRWAGTASPPDRCSSTPYGCRSLIGTNNENENDIAVNQLSYSCNFFEARIIPLVKFLLYWATYHVEYLLTLGWRTVLVLWILRCCRVGLDLRDMGLKWLWWVSMVRLFGTC